MVFSKETHSIVDEEDIAIITVELGHLDVFQMFGGRTNEAF